MDGFSLHCFLVFSEWYTNNHNKELLEEIIKFGPKGTLFSIRLQMRERAEEKTLRSENTVSPAPITPILPNEFWGKVKEEWGRERPSWESGGPLLGAAKWTLRCQHLWWKGKQMWESKKEKVKVDKIKCPPKWIARNGKNRMWRFLGTMSCQMNSWLPADEKESGGSDPP